MSLKAATLAALFAAANVLPLRAKAGLPTEAPLFEVSCYAGGTKVYSGQTQYATFTAGGMGIVDGDKKVVRSNADCVAIQYARLDQTNDDPKPFEVTCYSGATKIYQGRSNAVSFTREGMELLDLDGSIVRATAKCIAVKPPLKLTR